MNPTDEFTKEVESALENATWFTDGFYDPIMTREQALASIQASTVLLLQKLKDYIGIEYCEGCEPEMGACPHVYDNIDQLIKDLNK